MRLCRRRPRSIAILLGLILSGAVPSRGASGTVIHVPKDVKDLQTALARVGDGGVIELAAGVYPSPAAGFRIAHPGRSYTVRAAPGAAVAIDGGGARPLLDIANASREIVFERLTFRNGLADKSGRSAIRIEASTVRFVACALVGNRALAPAEGGALRAGTASTVTLAGCEVRGNSSQSRGGAVSSIQSRLFMARSHFADNHTDVASHGRNAAGGALYLLDSAAVVYDSLFEGNGAGYVGGAVYAYGTYGAVPGLPATELLLARSTLRQNHAAPCPNCQVAGPTEGGALHVENATTARLQRVIVDGNQAEDGGGLSSFRGRLELDDAVLRGNRALSRAGALRTGGAVVLFSNDPADPNGSGHAPASLAARRSLFEGRFGIIGATASSGACVAGVGDVSRADGAAALAFDRSVFFGCAAEPSATAAAGGGALYLYATALRLDDSLVLASSAAGASGQGGGVLALPGSTLAAARSTFSGNVASYAGGAIAAAGAGFAVQNGWFLQNAVAQGAFTPFNQSRGAAIFARPAPGGGAPSPVTGTVAGSTFLEQQGVPLFDVDQDSPPVNDLHYDGNQIANGSFGTLVYVLSPTRRDGLTVEELNDLVVFRGGAPGTDKARTDNLRAPFASRAASVLAIGSAGAVGADVGPQLAYAWAGGSAALDGARLQDRAGLVSRTPGASSTLTVDGSVSATAPAETDACTSGPVLCLRGGRFRVELRWRQAGGSSGAGVASATGPASGVLSLPAPAAGQVTVQLLDNCARNGHVWFNLDGTTNAASSATVLDTWSGQSASYAPAAGAAWQVRDRTSFSACGLRNPPAARGATP